MTRPNMEVCDPSDPVIDKNEQILDDKTPVTHEV